MMKLKYLTLIVAALIGGLAYAAPLGASAEPSAAGMWAQVYPDGRVGGWFLIFEHNGVFEGAIAKMFIQPGEDPDPICTHCPGEQKNMHTLGLVIIKGMQRNGLVYENGSILDPRDGQVYHAKLTLSPDGQQLTVRGYIGIELFGQNQVWRRLPDDVLPLDQMPPNLVPIWLAMQKAQGGMIGGGGPSQTGSIRSWR